MLEAESIGLLREIISLFTGIYLLLVYGGKCLIWIAIGTWLIAIRLWLFWPTPPRVIVAPPQQIQR
jgi:hypothetical protein